MTTEHGLDRDKARRHLEALAPEGVTFIGRVDQARPFELPAQIELALDHAASLVAAGADCYVTPARFKPGTTKRNKTNVEGARVAWVDVDAEWTRKQQAAYDRLTAELGDAVFRLETSPGKSHIYVQLAEKATPSESEALNRGLIALFGGDEAPKHVATWMRLAGTVHYPTPKKPGEPFQIVFTDPPVPEAAVDVALLRRALDAGEAPWSTESNGEETERAGEAIAAGRSRLVELLADPPGADDYRWNTWLCDVAGHWAKLIPYEDAFRLQVQRDADSLDGTWGPGEVEKVATSIWNSEQAKRDLGAPDGGTRELERLRARDWAIEQRRTELAPLGSQVPVAWALDSFLAIERPPRTWIISKLLAQHGKCVMSASYKVGKTTFVQNVVQACADGEPLFGMFETNLEGRILVMDCELDELTLEEWYRKLGVREQNRVDLWPLRGALLPWWTDAGAERVIEQLRRDVGLWIIDPWAPFMSGGGEENSNDDIARLLKRVDTIRREAGNPAVIVVAHTGHPGDLVTLKELHGRGASAMMGWPDALWYYGRVDWSDETRFFDAIVRGVEEIDEMRLELDYATWRLHASVESLGEYKQERNQVKAAKEQQLKQGLRRSTVVGELHRTPGLNRGALESTLHGTRRARAAAIDDLVTTGSIFEVDGGPGRPKRYYLPEDRP